MEQTPYRLIHCRTDGDILVVTITEPRVNREELAVALRKEIDAAGRESNARKVVFDLTAVEEMSSRGFCAILYFQQDLVKNHGGRVALCGLSEHIRTNLTTLRLIDVRGPSPVVTTPTTARQGTPAGRAPIFDIVTDDIEGALERLRAASAENAGA